MNQDSGADAYYVSPAVCHRNVEQGMYNDPHQKLCPVLNTLLYLEGKSNVKTLYQLIKPQNR